MFIHGASGRSDDGGSVCSRHAVYGKRTMKKLRPETSTLWQVSAPDAKTLVVELAGPCVYFDKIITHASMAPVKKDVVDANGDQWALAPETYVSNGPLKMIEWVPGSHMTFAKNENYWNAEQVTLNSLKFVLMEDSNAAYSAYQTGEVQMIKDIPTEEIPSLQDSRITIWILVLLYSYTIFNTQKAPFDNAKVRMALSLLLTVSM